jgi:hypothetical protein
VFGIIFGVMAFYELQVVEIALQFLKKLSQDSSGFEKGIFNYRIF